MATKEMCYLAFNALYSRLANKPVDKSLGGPISKISAPLFVTYTTKNDDLRGCIGTFQEQPLDLGIPEFAIIAGLEDNRFDPISMKELPNLQVTVSILQNFEKCDPLDWEVGKHGIYIEYGKYNATFLPEVAEEQHWNQQETIIEALRKGGYRGKVDQLVIEKIRCERYQSSKITVSWDEYIKTSAASERNNT